jgi:hypothetical protein
MRSAVLTAAALLAAAALVAAEEKPRSILFPKDSLGKLPPGWVAEKTGKGEGSVWKVVADATAPSGSGTALAQTAEGPGALFNLCVLQESRFKDLELRVAFKAVKGQKDQGGGFVWRYQDPNNYYVCRMNPLEDNYRVYHVVAGKRTQFGGKEGIKVPAGEWHRLSVRMVGDRIECSLDGQTQIEARDGTFTEPGKVGLWTKADAQTHFDDFQVRNLSQ